MLGFLCTAHLWQGSGSGDEGNNLQGEGDEGDEAARRRKRQAAAKRRKQVNARAAGAHSHVRAGVLVDDSPEVVVEEEDDPHDGVPVRRRGQYMWWTPR